MLSVILLYAFFSSSFTIGKALLFYSSPVFLTGVRMLIGGGVLLAYMALFTRKDLYFKREHWWLLAQVCVIGIFFTYTLRFWALRDLVSAKACFLYNLSPFFSALFSYFMFSERMSRKKWLGLIIGFLGMIPMLMSSSSVEQAAGEWMFISVAEFVIILSIACHCYSWIVIRKLVRDLNYSPLLINGASMVIGGAMALAASYIPFVQTHIEVTPHISNMSQFLKLLPLTIIISNFICHNLYAQLLRTYTATFMSFASFSSPFFAAFYGWFFLHEEIHNNFFISSVIVFAALYLFYQEELKSTKLSKHPEREIPNPIIED